MDFASLAQQLSSQPLTSMAVLFGFGVLTSLTPCIYPMIPITVALMGGTAAREQSGARKRWRPIALTLTYVLGLALTYSALGLFAGLSGTLFGTVATNPWLNFAMGNLLMLTALWMLDVIPLRLPAGLAQRAANAGNGGRFAGVFVMGAASGLVAAPCGAPAFIAVLSWVTTTRSAALGFAYLFVFSLGMSALLVAAGVSSGFLSSLPRAGPWMLWVKRAFAVVMIGVAEYYFVKMGQSLF